MVKKWKKKGSYTRKGSSGRRIKVRPHKQRYSKQDEPTYSYDPQPKLHLGNCGIFGIYANNGITTRHIDHFIEMMEYNKQRGSQATGVIIGPKPGRKRQIGLKTPGDPSVFLKKYKETLYQKAPGSRFIVGHGRRATRGNPQDNRNNHPLRGDSYWLVHNGVVKVNDDMNGNPYVLVDNEKTDSYILVDTLNKALKEYPNKYKAVQKSYEWHRGGATVAIGFDDGDLIIVTRTNPMLYIIDTDLFYFAQQPDIFPSSMQMVKIANGRALLIQKGRDNFIHAEEEPLSADAMRKLGVNWRTMARSYDWEDQKPKKTTTKPRKATKKPKKVTQKTLQNITKPQNIKRKPSPIMKPMKNLNSSQIKVWYQQLPNHLQVELFNKVTTSENDRELLNWTRERFNMDINSARSLIAYVDILLASVGDR